MKLRTQIIATLATAGCAVAALAIWFVPSQSEPLNQKPAIVPARVAERAVAFDSPPAEPAAPELTLETIQDPELVFKKAFWRRPGVGDRIAHAERREWVDTESSIAKWQWFIEVEPSAELRAWLATNPFMMAPRNSQAGEIANGVQGVPAWFPTEFVDHELYQSATGDHLIAISPDGKRLYATDSGGGFNG